MPQEIQTAAGTATGTGQPAPTPIKADAALWSALKGHSTQPPANAAEPPSLAGTAGSALFALILVVGLILLLGKLAKRLPGLQMAGGRGDLHVVSSLALGTRDRLVVVDVAGKHLLLGIGEGGPRLIKELDEPLPEAPAAATNTVGANFALLLAKKIGIKTP